MKYRYHDWLDIERNPDFEKEDHRFHYNFWYLKKLYNLGHVKKPASNEFIAYIDLLFVNVLDPIFNEFLYPDNEAMSKLLKVMVNALIEGRFDELMRVSPQKLDKLVAEKLNIEEKQIIG